MSTTTIILAGVYIVLIVVIVLLPMGWTTKLSLGLVALATLLNAYTIFSEIQKQNLLQARTDVEANEDSFTSIYRSFSSNPGLATLYNQIYNTAGTDSQNHAMMVVLIQQIDNILQFYQSSDENPPSYWNNTFRSWINTPIFNIVWPQVRTYYTRNLWQYIDFLRSTPVQITDNTPPEVEMPNNVVE